MPRRVSSAALVLAAVILSACETPYESSDDRLQRVGEATVQGIDTTGLDALR